MRGRKGGGEGEGEGRRGVGGGRGGKGREGRGKFCAREARAAPRREEGDKGWEGEVRGREGEKPTPCPPLINSVYYNVVFTTECKDTLTQRVYLPLL